jgi:hypothetical protein
MSDSNKKRCIVLLPSGRHFERLLDQVVGRAITQLGMIPSKWEALGPTPVNVFVDEIEQAAALLADISENTPEIWLAVGCAVALGTPLCLISMRQEWSAAFGIQHVPLIPYPANAFPSDYVDLQEQIVAQLSAIMPLTNIQQPKQQLRTPARPSASPSKPSDDLVSYEILAMTIIDRQSGDTGLSPRDLGEEMQASNCGHLTSPAMTALKRRRFIERRPVQVSEKNEVHTSENLFLTRTGKDWLARHTRKVTARRTAAHSRAQFINGR